MFQEFRYGEDGPCAQPSAHVVSRDMIQHRVVRNFEDVVLQFLQRVNSHHLISGFRVTKDEVAKSHVFLHEVSEVDVHFLRVLVYEPESVFLSLLLVFALRALQYQRHIFVPSSYFAQQFQSRFSVFLTVFRESSVANHAESIFVIAFI